MSKCSCLGIRFFSSLVYFIQDRRIRHFNQIRERHLKRFSEASAFKTEEEVTVSNDEAGVSNERWK